MRPEASPGLLERAVVSASAAPALLSVDGLVKSYEAPAGGLRARIRAATTTPPPPAVNGVTFDVREGELFTLLGPSGCGKTTTLRSIAGLETPTGGTIAVAGRTLFDAVKKVDVPTNKRNLGMVFQSYAIWPHMSVHENVAFPFKVAPRKTRLSRAEMNERVERVLDVTGLSEFVSRPATNLSGGQQQRLALARAMVTQPSLMLLDEPLSNLDAKLRESMRLELSRLQREYGLTSIYVTHDQAEALSVSTRIAVMNRGRIEQLGTPHEIYRQPATRFVAEFVGTSNLVDGTIQIHDGDRFGIATPAGLVWAAPSQGIIAERQRPGGAVAISMRPENLHLTREAPREQPGLNIWPGKVLARAFTGDSIDYVVQAQDTELRVRVNPSVVLQPGEAVFVAVAPADVIVVHDVGPDAGSDAGQGAGDE
jgi:iron(III) transport system ATP-binding protein